MSSDRPKGSNFLNLLGLCALGVVKVPTQLQVHPETGRRSE